MHNVFQFSPERIPLSGAGGITLFFTQSNFAYAAVINHTVINGTIVGDYFLCSLTHLTHPVWVPLAILQYQRTPC